MDNQDKTRKLAERIVELLAEGKAREERRKAKEERFRNALGIRLKVLPTTTK